MKNDTKSKLIALLILVGYIGIGMFIITVKYWIQLFIY